MRSINSLSRAAILVPAIFLMVPAAPLLASETDRRVENTIKDSYNFKTTLAKDDIAVHASAGVVTLSGTAAEDANRVLAAETAENTAGVKSVVNLVKVKGEQPSEHSDAWTTMKVKTVLAFHKNVSASGTEVDTADGVVTLKGKAESEAQKELTTEYARDVEGVKEVDNQLTVTGKKSHETIGAKIDDASITARIKSSLLFHRSTHAIATKVKTQKGVVTLHGEARNAAEKDLVGRLAGDTEGVQRVDNRMTIKSS
jgi:hyperosmotically inducible periplasmic protein